MAVKVIARSFIGGKSKVRVNALVSNHNVVGSFPGAPPHPISLARFSFLPHGSWADPNANGVLGSNSCVSFPILLFLPCWQCCQRNLSVPRRALKFVEPQNMNVLLVSSKLPRNLSRNSHSQNFQ